MHELLHSSTFSREDKKLITEIKHILNLCKNDDFMKQNPKHQDSAYIEKVMHMQIFKKFEETD